jgi:hypothetical protein
VREQVYAVFPVSQFAEAYEAVRSEEPVFIGYTWAPLPSDPDHYGDLLQVGITSDDQAGWDTQGELRRIPEPSRTSG